jgi:hypothetical protein
MDYLSIMPRNDFGDYNKLYKRNCYLNYIYMNEKVMRLVYKLASKNPELTNHTNIKNVWNH